jgi:mannosylglucosylglycerate synthase
MTRREGILVSEKFRIGILSGKLGDVDGVSLETDKWIEIFTGMGHEIFTIAGKYANPVKNVPGHRQFTVPHIAFDSPQQKYVEKQVFPHLTRRSPHVSASELGMLQEELETEGREVAATIQELVQNNDIDVLVAENTNAMPMTLLGGLGMYKAATEGRIATIFHHHDFWWERSRFSRNRIEGLLNVIMPPVDLGLEHIVISSYAAHILRSLKRVQPHIVPNCEDFENPVGLDEYNSDLRENLGFGKDDILIVQPTRIVPRKRIEDSLELIRRLTERWPDLRERIRYIISLYQGDEPDEDYVNRIREEAERQGIQLQMISKRVSSVRGRDTEGRKLYTNRDILAHADLVTYLPIWEGFGNAFLEAVAARVPVVITTYLVYKTDIMPLGFRNVEIRDRYADNTLVIPDNVLEEIRNILDNPDERGNRVEHNFQIARREFGMDRLRVELETVLGEYGDEIRASRKRIRKSKARYSV